MSAQIAARPTATAIEVDRLVTMAWEGAIRVPHLQRDFRWLRRDVIRLFESIFLGYPVGSLLLWRHAAPAQTLQLGGLRIDAPKTGQALWVVDGQQRIISLANALHRQAWDDDRFRIAYDLETDRFVPLPSQWVERPLVIPLPVLFDLRSILNWFHTRPEITDYADHANEITTRLRQYRVPAYEVEHDDEEILRDIFDRMNNFGKRLSRAEVFSALFPSDQGRAESLSFDQIAAGIDLDLGFGVIDKDTVLKAVLARRGPDPLREVRNELDESVDGGLVTTRSLSEFPEEDRDTAYRLGEEALRRAVRFLQRDAGVPHVTFLPYRHLLVVLTRLFAHHPDPDPVNRRRLRRWFWRAAVVGPEVFKGSTTGAIRTLCHAIRRDDLTGSVDDLLKLVAFPDRPVPDLRRFRSNEAGTKIVLCAWWAEEPCSLRDGEKLDQAELAASLLDRATAADAVRNIVPRLRAPEPYRLWAANRVLLPDPAADNLAVEAQVVNRPLDLAEPVWEATLGSHLLDDELLGLLAAGRVEAFFTNRHQRLVAHLDTFLQRSCEWSFEDTPPLTELVMADLDDGDEPA